MNVKSITKVAAVAALTVGFAAATVPAQAGPGTSARSGSCVATSTAAPATWTLAAQPEGGRIVVEAQVHSNVVGQNWVYAIQQSRPAVHSGPITSIKVLSQGMISTHNPNGSFQLRVLAADRQGPQKITFRAMNPQTKTFCRGSLTI